MPPSREPIFRLYEGGEFKRKHGHSVSVGSKFGFRSTWCAFYRPSRRPGARRTNPQEWWLAPQLSASVLKCSTVFSTTVKSAETSVFLNTSTQNGFKRSFDLFHARPFDSAIITLATRCIPAIQRLISVTCPKLAFYIFYGALTSKATSFSFVYGNKTCFGDRF